MDCDSCSHDFEQAYQEEFQSRRILDKLKPVVIQKGVIYEGNYFSRGKWCTAMAIE